MSHRSSFIVVFLGEGRTGCLSKAPTATSVVPPPSCGGIGGHMNGGHGASVRLTIHTSWPVPEGLQKSWLKNGMRFGS